MSVGKLYGVGLGPGDPKLLTVRAMEVLKLCGRVFEVIGSNSSDSVSGNILNLVGIDNAKRIGLRFSMARDKAVWGAIIESNAEVIAAELEKGVDCAFASLGDPLIYSTFSYVLKALRQRIPELAIEVVPGITSFQAAAAKAAIPLVEDGQTLLLAPLHNELSVERAFSSEANTLALLKVFKTKKLIASYIEKELGDEVVYASRLSLDGEFITRNLDEVKNAPETYLSLLLVKRKGRKNG